MRTIAYYMYMQILAGQKSDLKLSKSDLNFLQDNNCCLLVIFFESAQVVSSNGCTMLEPSCGSNNRNKCFQQIELERSLDAIRIRHSKWQKPENQRVAYIQNFGLSRSSS